MQNPTVTFVTALIDLNEDRSRERSPETRINLFRHIANSGVAICLYVSSTYEDIAKELENEYKNIKLMPIINLEDTQTYKIINELNPALPATKTDYHDTRQFITLMNAKSEYVYNATLINPFNTTHFSWIDFSIFHVIKNIEQAMNQLCLFGFSELKQTFLLFPCCWTPEYSKQMINNIALNVFWRFCGGFFIGDINSIQNMHYLMLEQLHNFIKEYGILVWEINMWAWLEVKHNWKIDYYIADHNDTILNIPAIYLNNDMNSNTFLYKSTIVTFYFNITQLKDKTNESRDSSFYMEKGIETLKLQYPMVIFCDEENYNEIKCIRDKYIFNPKLTNYIIKNISEYDFYKENYDIIIENRENDDNYKNSRNNSSYFLITMFKIIAIYIAKQRNFYNTDYYAWIDFGGSHVVRNFSSNASNMLDNPNSKISLCYIHYRSHEELYPMTKYYKSSQICGIAATSFTIENKYVNKFYNGCLSIFHETLLNNVGHSEETIFTYFYDRYPELCNIYNGDYYSVFENYHEPIGDFNCIKLFFIDEAIRKGRLDLAETCVNKLITSNNKNNLNIHQNDLNDLISLQNNFIKNKNEISINTKSNFNFTESNVFCIILENNPRELNMIERMKQINLPYTKWVASTPDTLTDNFNTEIDKHSNSKLVKACAQSHINIWRHIINNNIEYALVLEDDACFDKDWKNKLEKFKTDVEENNEDIEDIKNNSNWDCILLSASEPLHTLNKWLPVTWQYSTIGYIISNKGAKWILEEFKDCFNRSDHMTLALQNQGKCYSYFPWLVIQDGLNSTIGSDIDFDNNKLFTNLEKINYSLDNYVR